MAVKAISPLHAFLMITLILFWGSSFVVVKTALKEGLTPIAMATFRFLTAGGLFIAALAVRKALNRNYRLLTELKDAPILMFLSLSGVTFFFMAQYTGIKLAGASVAAILVCLLSPTLITLFSAKIFKEYLSRSQVLGMGIAAAGTFIVIAGGTMADQSGAAFLTGSLILLSTPFLWAAYSLLGKRTVKEYDAFLVVSYVNILGGFCLVPFSLAEGSLCQIVTISLYGWLAILFLASTCSLLGYFIWFYVLGQIGSAAASSFLFAEPLVTAIFAIVFAGEELSPLVPVGGLLIFAGVYAVTKKHTNPAAGELRKL
jgi:drug/metabolite transporter (DMT)-like permease